MLNSLLKKNGLSWNHKIKIMQGLCFFGGPLVLFFHFNFAYLVLSFIAANLIVNLGIGLCYHRMYAHRSWKPRSSFVEAILYFLGIICTMGPVTNWAGTHRLHHATADTDKDPHSPVGKPLWKKIAYWFNYWEKHEVSPKLIKDLLRQDKHKFVHKNYFKLLFTYIIILGIIDIELLLYGYIVTTMFILHFVSWITVGAHIWGHREHETNDKSLNTNIMGWFLWGEGYHNNHHANSSNYDFGRGKFDLGARVIEFLV